LYGENLEDWVSEDCGARKTSEKLLYIHKAGMERRVHHRKILKLQKELEEHREQKLNASLYERYFLIKDTPKRGRTVTIRHNVVKSDEQYYGFFALLSNCITDKTEALSIYRTKDCVEKAFGNLKERLGLSSGSKHRSTSTG